MNLKNVKTLKPAEVQRLRRFLHMVGHELLTTAKNDAMPDQWDEISNCQWTMAAIVAIYDQMAVDGLLPKRFADGTPSCGHRAYRAGYCGEMSCPNYVGKHT